MTILKNSGVKVIANYDDTFFEKKLVSFGYPVNKNQHIHRTRADWEIMKGYSFFYDYVGNEELVQKLKKSRLCNPERVLILESDPGNPIIEIPSLLFAEKWEDILTENSYGVCGISKDGELVFEFTDDSEYLLHSNFFVK